MLSAIHTAHRARPMGPLLRLAVGRLLRLTVVCCLALAPALAAAAPAGDSLQQIREFRAAHEHAIPNELAHLLAIPNVASDRPDIRRNAEALALMLRQ